MSDDVILRMLVEEGATPASAARAAYVLRRGGTTREAEDEIVLEDRVPATFDMQLLIAAAQRELAAIERRQA